MTAAAYRVVELWCDNQPDPTEHEHPDGFIDDVGITLAQLRKIARNHGWLCNRTGDYCPHHRTRS